MRPFDSKDAYRLKKFVQERDRELSLAWDGLSPQDRSLALSLLEQARRLSKPCPNEKSCRKWGVPIECSEGDSECAGTGSLPVTKDDVEVKLK